MPARNPSKSGADRRTAPRLPASSIPSLKGVKLVAGSEVKLLNISRGGALIESESRLTPGANLCLRLVTAESVYLLKGRVLRSKVTSLDGTALRYHSALTFEEEFAVLPAGSPEAAAESEAAAPAVCDLSLQASDAAPIPAQMSDFIESGGVEDYYTVTIPCPDNDVKLRKLLDQNAW
jgi:hypothetical protein